MKRSSVFLTLFFCCLCIGVQAQYVRMPDVPVTIFADTLANPWAGGLNTPQFSSIDLNRDGREDLFVFEREGDMIRTYVNTGDTGVKAWHFAPEYIDSFPKTLSGFTLLRDWNCDGYPDIFTYTTGGMAVYTNTRAVDNKLGFVLSVPLLMSTYSSPVNLYVLKSDIPAIDDLDNDGDLDVLTFSVLGTTIEYHRNWSVENGRGCDTLWFALEDNCWGKMAENSASNGIILNYNCKSGTAPPSGNTAHSGSTLLTLDLDRDTVKDLVLGDISFPNLVSVSNGGDLYTALAVAYDTLFPANNLSTTPASVPIFPGSFYVDVDNDGIRDLITAPNTPASSENYRGVLYHHNDSLDDFPVFTATPAGFLQRTMLDLGTAATPAFFDADADGLTDIVAGNYGYYSSTGVYNSRLMWLRNTGTAAQPSFALIYDDYQLLSSLNLNAICPAFGDMDADGDEDMVIGDYDGHLYYFNNTAGSGNPASFTLADPLMAGIDVGLYATPFIYDIDEDGDLDIVVGERSGLLKLFLNQGNAGAYSFTATPDVDTLGNIDVMPACCTGFSRPWMGHINGNAATDLLVSAENGYVYRYGNIDGNIYGTFALTDSFYTHSYIPGISAADINGDGHQELIIGEQAGGMALYTDATNGTQSLMHSGLKLSIKPNPANKNLSVSTGIPAPVHFTILTIDGKLIEQGDAVAGWMVYDVSALPDGVYLVLADTKYGRAVGKIVVLKNGR